MEPEEWPTDFALRLDAVCCRFEDQLRYGQPPVIDDYLQGFAADERMVLQAELQAIQAQWQDRHATLGYSGPTEIEPSVVVPARYRAERELGRGGMGVVYQAKDEQLQRRVALKMILSGTHADARQRTRFQAEAEAVATLVHPNIVALFDCGECDGKPYLVFEFVDGGTLTTRLTQGLLAPRTVAELGVTLAQALQVAHQAGLIHRDLKPSNILFTSAGIPKVSDFGLVKRLDGDSAYTQTGEGLGTPAYMPPEQAGQAKDVGPEADVYALGALLYECLVGRPPFVGATVFETLRQVLHDEPIPPRRLRTDVPTDLEAVCLKCLEKAPHNRYRTMTALAEDLQNFLCGQPTERPISAWRRLEAELYARNIALAEREWAAGRMPQKTLYLNACPTEWRGWEWYCLAELRDGPLTLRDHEDVVYGVTVAPDGRTIASVSDDQTLRVWDALTGALRQTLRSQTDQLYTPRFTPQGTEIVTASQAAVVKIWHLATGTVRELVGHTDVVVGIDLSRDGQYVASASDDMTVRLWDLATGATVRVFTGHTDMVNAVAFAPTGDLLASASYDQTVRLWNCATGHERLRLCKHTGFVWTVAFSPDGQHLASAGGDGTIRVWDVATGAERFILTGHAGVIWSVVFSPDGTRLASAGWDKTIRLWHTATGQEVLVLRSHVDAVNSLAFSPDGTRLVSASDDRTMTIWVAEPKPSSTAPAMRTLRDDRGALLTLAFRSDGRQLAAAGDDRCARVWDVGQGMVQHTLVGHRALIGGITGSPTEPLWATASADKTVRLWDANTGACLRVLEGHTDRVYGIDFSPDGRFLATGSWDRTVRLWDVATGRMLRMLGRHTNWVWSVRFAPDGLHVASSSTDRTVRLWPLDEQQPSRIVGQHALKVLGVAFAADGHLLASAGGDNIAKLWKLSGDAEHVVLTGHNDRVTSVAFASFAPLVATASEDQTVRVWNEAGNEKRVLLGHARRVTTVQFSPTERLLASGSDDGTIILWNLDE